MGLVRLIPTAWRRRLERGPYGCLEGNSGQLVLAVEGKRGQLVLAAAAVVALAMAPVVLAYLQLGYHEDITASAGYDDPAADATLFLERAVHEAGEGIPREYRWSERRDGVRTVRDRLAPGLATLAGSRVAEGTAYEVDYNRSAADRWAASNCPGGRGRAFGDCEADRGVVVQERAGETHVLAVAFDATVTTESGRTELTLVVRAIERG